jgi:EmrB/QacA subfamily drug resistance transporter
MAFIEGSVVNLALPAIQAQLRATSTGVVWVVNSYLLVLGAFMLIGGSLGDRFGLRRIFMAGTAVFGVSALACAFAPSLFLLTMARLIQGIGGALLVPNSLALVSRHFGEEERGRAIGIWAGASALTTAIGPVIGGWLVDRWGWPAVFLFIAPLSALTVIVAGWRVPVNPGDHTRKLDFLGSLLLVACLGSLIYALVDPGPRAQRTVFFILAVSLGAAFFWREKNFHSPMLPLALFRSRTFSGANVMTLLLYFALSGALYFLPFNLIQVQGYSALQAGAAFLPFTLVMGFGSVFAGDLIRKINPRIILTVGPIVAALGFFGLAIPGDHASFVTGFLPGIVTIGVGMTLSVTPLTTVVIGSVDDRLAGVASGLNNTAARLAGVLSVAVLTTVAVGSFAGTLEALLHADGVQQGLIDRVSRDASHLAELKPPVGTPEHAAGFIVNAVKRAYVRTFRILAILCGVIAILSGMVALLFLSTRDPVRGRRSGHRSPEGPRDP